MGIVTENSVKKPVILQILPKLESGGVERGTIDIAKAIIDSGFESIVIAENGRLVSRLEKTGAIYIDMPVGRKHPLEIVKNIFRVRKVIKQYQVDIVHARSRIPAWVSYFACKKTKATFITTFHGTYSVSNCFKRYYNSIMLKGAKIIAVSSFIKDHIIAQYCPKPQVISRISTIPRGVDTDYFDPDKISIEDIEALVKKWKLGKVYGNKKIIMLPGRISRWKGHLDLIEAIQLVKASNFIVLIVGGFDKTDNYYKEIIDKIERYNLGNKIFLVGHTDDIRVAYAISDFIISASNKAEAFGRVIAEGGAMRKVVIATNMGGAREIIINKQTGFLVNHIQQMEESITKALSTTETKIREIENNAYEYVRKNFSLTKMCNKTIKLYKEILQISS